MNFKIGTTSEKINNIGGIAIAGKIIKATELKNNVNKILTGKRKPRISNFDIIGSYLGLLLMGRTFFEDINLFKPCDFFLNALGLKRLPSAERLRQRMDEIKGSFDKELRESNINLLKTRSFGEISTSSGSYIPWDCDVSPMDNSKSNKEEVSRTYKGFDGYAPMFGYLGTEGYMLDCELRPGKQHCQNGTVEFIRRNLKAIKELGVTGKTLLRMDSGNDAIDNLHELHGNSRYIIKRNLRREIKEQWLEKAMTLGEKHEVRPGKSIYYGVQYGVDIPEKEDATTCIAFKVTVRDSDAKGQLLLKPELEVETYYTDLAIESAEEIIKLYHDHGTSEQFHSELKSDMDVERLPSGKFQTNSLVLLLAMMAYNCLRTIGQGVIELKEYAPVKIKVKRRRLKCVIRDIITVACKYVRHSNANFIKFGRESPWYEMYRKLYARFS